MNREHFPLIILIGRPASGKSEIIDYLSKTPPEMLRERFHLAEIDVFDDFPMLWIWFEEDHILSAELGQARLYTDAQGYFKFDDLWHLLIHRLGLEYSKRLRDDPVYPERTTTIIEFSRGGEHGGYREAFQHLPDALLKDAAVVYVRVSFQESLRKNRLRFNPERPDSILEHALPDEKLERLYRQDDWENFSAGDPNWLAVKGIQLPYAVFENEDDVTGGDPDRLATRLEAVLDHLWNLRTGKM